MGRFDRGPLLQERANAVMTALPVAFRLIYQRVDSQVGFFPPRVVRKQIGFTWTSYKNQISTKKKQCGVVTYQRIGDIGKIFKARIVCKDKR